MIASGVCGRVLSISGAYPKRVVASSSNGLKILRHNGADLDVTQQSADVAIVTKIDLAAAVEFDSQAAYGNIQAVRPGMPIFNVSAKTEAGMEQYMKFLAARLAERSAAAV